MNFDTGKEFVRIRMESDVSGKFYSRYLYYGKFSRYEYRFEAGTIATEIVCLVFSYLVFWWYNIFEKYNFFYNEHSHGCKIGVLNMSQDYSFGQSSSCVNEKVVEEPEVICEEQIGQLERQLREANFR